MMETVLPKHKPLIGEQQTNRIRNCIHGRGARNPWTNLNKTDYKSGLQDTIICSRIILTYRGNVYVSIYGTEHGISR